MGQALDNNHMLLAAGICDICIVGGLFLLGTLVLRLILGKVDWLAIFSLSFGLGSGLFAWLLFILSWAGLLLNKTTVLGSFVALLIVLALLGWRIRRPLAEDYPAVNADGKIATWTKWGLWIVILLLVATVTFLAIGLSYFGWDDIAYWTIKGYGIALQGTVLAAANWGGNGLSYPLNIPILISIFRILDGDLLPGSKLIYPIFFSSLLIGCYRFWVFQGLRKWVAALGVLLLGSTPILFTHAFMGYANLPFTYYMVSGLIWSIQGIQKGATGKTLLGGMLLAIAILTRPEGLIMLSVSILSLGIACLLTARGRLKLLPLLLPALILAVPWYIFLREHASLDVQAYQYSGLAVKALLVGDFKWPALFTLIRYVVGQVVRFRDWGFTLLLLGMLLIIGLRPRDLRHDLVKSALFFLSVGLSLVVIGSDYMAAYTPGGSEFLYEWSSVTFTRVFMPAGICLALLGFLVLKDLLKLQA